MSANAANEKPDSVIPNTTMSDSVMPNTIMPDSTIPQTTAPDIYSADKNAAGNYAAGNYAAGNYVAGNNAVGNNAAGNNAAGNYVAGSAIAGSAVAGITAVGAKPTRADRKAARLAARLEKKNKKRRGLRRKRRKGWIFLLLIIIAAGGYFVYQSVFGGTVIAPLVRSTQIARGNLQDTVSVSGNVQSTVKRSVYSNLAFTVKSVNVEVGDAVVVGQTLCELDTEDLELNIAQARADLKVAVEASDNQIESSQKTYDDAAQSLADGTNAQILSSESAVRNASIALLDAETNYNNLLRDYNQGSGANRKSAMSAMVSAKSDLDARAHDLETSKSLFEAGASARDTLTQAENAYNSSLNRYNDAVESVELAKTAEERAIEQAQNSLRSARTAFDNAQTALSSAKTAAEQELYRYESSVSSSIISANVESREIAIKKLEKQLADSQVTAPVAGVITAVYANEGSSSAGLLFVIEDPSSLIIETKIKEYDAGSVAVGMPVVIRSDAVLDAEYAGTLKMIEPAAIKTPLGETDTTTDIEYGAEVSVDSADTMLRIGMNARLDVILDSRENIYSVSFDSIATNAAGQSVVYTVEKLTAADAAGAADSAGTASAGTDGSADAGAGNGADAEAGGTAATAAQIIVAREIPVEIGMETDFYVEIISDKLRDGMRIINYMEGVQLYDGAQVSLMPEEAASL